MTNTTYKQTAIGLIPSEWEVRKLGEIADVDKKSLKSDTNPKYQFDYISLSDVDSDDFNIETSKQIFKSAPSRARRIVNKGDILMSTVRPNLQGFSIIRNNVNDLIASTGFAVITANDCDNFFLYQYIFSNPIQKQFYGLLVGSNYPVINSSDVKLLKIPLPPLAEQQKIAALLSTWDVAIDNCKNIIEKISYRNKGLEQQFLSGKIRVKGFEKTQWHLKSVEEVAVFKNGKAHENCIDEEGDYFVVNSKFISTQGKVAKASNENLCPLFKSDITMVMSDIPNGKALAKCFYIPEDNKYTLNQRICALTARKGINSKFLYYQMNRNNYYLAFNNGVSQTNLKKEEVLECPLLMPDVEEQIQIVKLIDTATEELKQYEQKLQTLQLQKKGLMQQLLTGKVRVKI